MCSTSVLRKCSGLVTLLSVLGTATARTLAFHPPVHELHPIPHIIHQTWTNSTQPEAQTRRQDSWRATHPHWEYKSASPLRVGTAVRLLSAGTQTRPLTLSCVGVDAQAVDGRGQHPAGGRALCMVRLPCISLTHTLQCAKLIEPACQCRLKDFYDNLPDVEMQREASRYLYLHHYGGAARSIACCLSLPRNA